MLLECFLDAAEEAMAGFDRGLGAGVPAKCLGGQLQLLPVLGVLLIELLNEVHPTLPAGSIFSLHTHTHTV